MLDPFPIGLPGLAVFAVMFLISAVLVLTADRAPKGDSAEAGAKRSRAATLGIAIQALGFGIAGFGPMLVTLDPLGPTALSEAALIALLMAAAAGLFRWSSRTMGRNWSIRARTRTDHQLVQDGPFARLRHPIYLAMTLFLLAMALAMGHARQLVVALPVFGLGTFLRIRSEEALLHAMFGTEYEGYAAQVKRFGLF